MRFSSVALILPLVFSGCSTLNSTVQLGKPVAADDAKQLEGVWVGRHGHTLYVGHLKANKIKVAWVGWDKLESKFQLQEITAFVTDDENTKYINVVNFEEQSENPPYWILRLDSAGEESVLIRPPIVESFARAVEQGVLPGKVTKKYGEVDVRIDPPAEKLAEFVTPSKVAEQFRQESPLELRRVSRFDEDRQ